jgi:hypothetical protein
MSDYGWDHHDDPDLDPGYLDPGYGEADEVVPPPDVADAYLGPEDTWDEPPAEVFPDDEFDLPAEPYAEDVPPVDADVAGPAPAEVVGADPDAVPEPDAGGAEVFPPMVDVGPLPEPVDGFPWIDTGSLGIVDPAAAPVSAVDDPGPQELAGYAAADLPPAQDPWDALAASDDPATAALARFYRPDVAG